MQVGVTLAQKPNSVSAWLDEKSFNGYICVCEESEKREKNWRDHKVTNTKVWALWGQRKDSNTLTMEFNE
jgi:hypothetical protein